MTAETAHALLNGLAPDEAARALARCCGSSRWVAAMLAARPFASEAALHRTADDAWAGLGAADFLEAFSHHPAIGARAAPMSAWSAEEQSRAAASTATATTDALHTLNEAYAARFGYTFIVCATCKTADEILALLRDRLDHDDATELAIAAAEQARITHLRLEKLAR